MSESLDLPEKDLPEQDIIATHAAIAREDERPAEGHEPLPVFMAISFATLLMWGGWYLGNYSEQFERDAFDLGALTSAPVVAEPEDPSVVGERVYTVCQACHQADGSGVAGTFPPLAGSEWAVGNPRVFAAIVLDGLEGPIEVGGSNYNSVMPAWGDRYDDDEIAAVLTHVRTHFGNDAGPVTSELVAEVRGVAHEGAWTVSSLEAAAELQASDEAEDEDAVPEDAVPEDAVPEDAVPEDEPDGTDAAPDDAAEEPTQELLPGNAL